MGNNSNSLYQNKNREGVKNREIRYLPDLSIVNLLSVFVLVERILNYYPNYAIHCLYFGEVETPYITKQTEVFPFTRAVSPFADIGSLCRGGFAGLSVCHKVYAQEHSDAAHVACEQKKR